MNIGGLTLAVGANTGQDRTAQLQPARGGVSAGADLDWIARFREGEPAVG
jgi:hypothetical protein